MNVEEKAVDRASLCLCEIKSQIFRVLRHLPVVKEKAVRKKYGKQPILSVEKGRKVLCEAIERGEPFMVARFGTSEGVALYEYWKAKLFSKAYSEKYLDQICMLSGFFPNDLELLYQWAELETNACADLDVLGNMNFVGEEWIYNTFCSQAQIMPAGGLGSASHGWTWVLEGKKVLVVHPFAETIMSQYKNHRTEIFPGTNALPLFDLKCVKAVQTIADATDERFGDWFEALDYMTEEVKKQDFDIALLGCGAYGFQLASRIKRMGKIAIHMGGSLQTLFGIKGGRWDVKYGSMYNDAWVYPSQEETPRGFEKVEGGCYWNNK